MTEETTVAEFHAEYIPYREGTVEPATVLADDLAYRKFASHLPKGHRTPLMEIRPRHGDQFMAACTKQGLKATSTTNHYRHLHREFAVAKLWDHIEANPFDDVKPPRVYKAPPRFIPMEEIGPFLRGVEDFDKRMFLTGLYATGRRRCELLDLRWKDINWKKREYRVRVTKVHREVVLPVSSLFREVLIEQRIFWPTADKVFPKWKNPDSVTHWVKQELIKGGYPDLHLHHLRHSFASAYVAVGGNIFTLSKLLTHSNVNTTQIYSHLTQEYLRAEVDKVRL